MAFTIKYKFEFIHKFMVETYTHHSLIKLHVLFRGISKYKQFSYIDKID
jgi:hypothetical protein